MASPALQSMCCLFVNESRADRHHVNWKTVLATYNTLCVISSFLSVVGALYQLLPRQPAYVPRTKKELESFLRQNQIICWLTFADLCASIGILVRSAMWLADFVPWTPVLGEADVDPQHVFCAVSSAVIQYFYICTYFWTFFYAVDIYRLVCDKPSLTRLYHSIGWTTPALFTVGGLLPYYLPRLTSCHHFPTYWLPHYIFTYLPILTVMIVNPILYNKASHQVQITMKGRGLYTNHERRLVENLQGKFFSVTLVFYLCWSPNILNGILLPVYKETPTSFLLALWHFMAVVNPMQAFLNSLVYRGVGGCNISWPSQLVTSGERTPEILRSMRKRRNREDIQATSQSQTDFEDSSETAPLLFFRR